MPDFNLRSDAVNVEQIMEQIRARIREKRGVDYTEAEIRELASVKLEKFLDPRGVRSDLLEQFRKTQPPYAPPELPNYAFEDQTLFESTRGPLRLIRKLLHPILKLFFNPNPLIQALNIQSKLNASLAEREAKRDAARFAFDQLHYEVMHNLVLETTRLGIEVKNLKMRIESLASRLEFNERRARALESAVVYKPATDERAGRAEEPRRDDARRDDGRRDEPRREDSRRDEPRRQESRRQERQERADPPPRQQPPAPPAPSPEPAVAPPAAPADAGEVDGGQTAAAEGPGQRSRRRRRRRGRRGSGAAAALMAGAEPGADGGAEGDDQPDGPEGNGGSDEEADGQESGERRPAPEVRATPSVPSEHTGNVAPSDAGGSATPPSPAANTSATESVQTSEPTPDAPSAAPEQ